MSAAVIYFENDYIDISKTFDCGQCFRWREVSDGQFRGIVGGQVVTCSVRDSAVHISFDRTEGLDEPRESLFWRRYFDLDTDYVSAVRELSADAYLRTACQAGHGIVLLNQEPFETLISFIISQNNNISRIRGIIERLCENFGTPLYGAQSADIKGYSFPTAEKLAQLEIPSLDVLRAGFRAKYILDAARKVESGEVDFSRVQSLGYDEAKAELCRIKGVGDKVADCVLLFSCGKRQSFPKDVWIKRVIAGQYADGLPDCVRGREGIAQQMMFYHARYGGGS
ncbi:8-oxoguanine DNA glycosylase [Clostridia bacterium]|nr:8-oxoguanine DNA glycosylase [Clostridia bacterium]